MSSNWRHGGLAAAMAGLALTLAGCGGGGGDSAEVTEGTPSEFGNSAPAPAPAAPGGEEAPPAPEAPPAEVAATTPAAPPTAAPADPAAAAENPAAPVAAAAGDPTPAPAPATPSAEEDNANTLALLQAANTPAAASPAPDTANPNSNGQPMPGAGPGSVGIPPGPGGPAAEADPGLAAARERLGQPAGMQPASSGRPQIPDGSEPPSPGMPRPPGIEGPGGPGMEGPGGPAGPGGGSDTKSNFTTPEKAVESFLSAVKARDLERLAEATSRRSTEEAHPKMKPIFQAILERTISADEIGEIATELEGYKPFRRIPAQSTGRVQIMLSKDVKDDMKRHVFYTRLITTRREKNEWRIMDISKESKLIRPR